MADDDDAIYVDVKARVDEASADEAEAKLKDKFKDVTASIGDSIKDATRSIGDHVKDIGQSIGGSFKDYLEQDIKDSVKDFGTGLRDQVKSGDVRGALDDIEHTVRGATDLITGLGEAFGVHLDGVGSAGHAIGDTISDIGDRVDAVTGKVHSFSSGLHAFRSGDIASGVNNLGDAFNGLLPDSLQEHLSDTLQVFNDTHDTIKGTVDTLHELRGAMGFLKGAGEAGGGAGLATSFLGPEVALPVAAAVAAGYGVNKGVSALARNDYNSWAFGDQGIPVPQHALGGLGKPVIPSPMTPVSQIPSFAPLDMPDDPSDPKNLRRYANAPTTGIEPVVRDGYSPGGGGGGSSNVQAQTATVEAGSATVMASSVSLGGISLSQIVGSIPTTAGGGTITNQVNDPRSKALSGMGLGPVSAPSSGYVSRPGSSIASALPSIAPQDHHDIGGILPGSSPGHDNMLGSLGGRPIGLEGGEFVVNPQATKDNLALLKAINASAHFDEGGQVPGGGGQGPKQPQSIGEGKGISVGGGALGMAEQGAAMMAGPLGPAVSIGEQEANLAVQKVGQMGAALAMAPYETFHLGGGQMGAPTAGKGWAGKILGGLVGQQDKLANMAGAVMKPKQPQQPGEGDPHLPGQPPPNQAPGPQGTKDDPIHTKNATGQPGPPQGAATSHSNMQSPMHSQMTA